MPRPMKCSKCRAKCVSALTTVRRNPSSICIADQTGISQMHSMNDADFKMRIWSYMKPPRISEPIQAVNDERLETVRTMLDKSSREQPSAIHIDSNVNIQVLHDGTIRKTTSRIEQRTYPLKTAGFKLKGPTTTQECRPRCFPGGGILTSTRLGE